MSSNRAQQKINMKFERKKKKENQTTSTKTKDQTLSAEKKKRLSINRRGIKTDAPEWQCRTDGPDHCDAPEPRGRQCATRPGVRR